MIDAIVAVFKWGLKILVNDLRIQFRLNVGNRPCLPILKRHGPTNTHNLACLYRRVNFSRKLFVPLKEAPEYLQRLFYCVWAFRVYAAQNVSEPLKIKFHRKSSLSKTWCASGFPAPFYSRENCEAIPFSCGYGFESESGSGFGFGFG